MSTEDHRRVWVLNLDAEHELESGRRYTPSGHLRSIVARERRRLLGNLVAPGDLVLTEEEDGTSEGNATKHAEGLLGLAWCPTPRALARLAAAGASAPQAPTLDVLREVNARPFAAAVRAPLVEGSFEKHVVTNEPEALAQLARPASDGWLVRRTFGAAGRGRRRIAAGRPSAPERAWLAASLRRGPLVIEPWVQVTREYTRSGWVRRDGSVLIAPPCFQATTASGSWERTERAARGEVSRADDQRLSESVATAGAALASRGYFGPFGIDAYHHRNPSKDGRAHEILNPISEINARFTMDWTTAMVVRPERDEALTLTPR